MPYNIREGGDQLTHRHIPMVQKDDPKSGNIFERSYFMGRLFLIAAVTVLFWASWASAGNFDVLAQSGVIRPPTQPYLQPGAVVKTEFKSSLKTTSDEDLESDSDILSPEPVSARAKAKPAVAFKERSKGMASPAAASPKVAAEPKATGAAKDDEDLMDSNLEQQLVLPPPAPKTEEKTEETSKPAVETKKPETKAGADNKAKPKRVAKRIHKVSPSALDTYAQGTKPIRKVKPVTQNPWMNPAGAYAASQCPVEQYENAYGAPAAPSTRSKRVQVPNYRPMEPQAGAACMSSAPRGSMAAADDRIVRDGVTIKLAPAAAPPATAEMQDDSSGSDILSTAAEIIGLPFAFVSSFF